MSGAAGAAGSLSAMQQYEQFRQQFASPLAAPQPSPQVARCSAWVRRHEHTDAACRRPVRARACVHARARCVWWRPCAACSDAVSGA